MEWLKENAKKLIGLVGITVGLTAGVAYMVPGCNKTGDTLLDVKKGIEKVEPFVPGEGLPEGVDGD